jgi:hypothetical protein
MALNWIKKETKEENDKLSHVILKMERMIRQGRRSMGAFRLLSGIALIVLMTIPSGEAFAGGDDQPYTITAVPREMSYQGILKDSGGDPVEDSVYNITFRIFDVSTGGTSLWDDTLPCTTTAGVFHAMFSNVGLAFDVDYWLELEINSEILDPRQKLGMVGYAAVADTADFAEHVATVDGATGGTITGDVNIQSNLAVAGDINATGRATIGPGNANTALSAFVAGENDTAGGDYSSISGGRNNTASALDAAVGGGSYNTASGQASVIAGGYYGNASNENATIGGGWHNVASGVVSTVGGGQEDTASGTYSTIAGGFRNAAGSYASMVGGGTGNKAIGSVATIAGGGSNYADAEGAAIGGGTNNHAGGAYSVIPGGSMNSTLGFNSFAAGANAIANHEYSFVWNSNFMMPFTTTGPHQFLINASGGVGINKPNPESALDVDGVAKCSYGGVDFFMVPRGAIIMWSGLLTNIPSGWALCDGSNGTPDLRDRFIYGVQAGENPGATGGNSAHTHDVDIPAFATGTPSHYWWGGGGGIPLGNVPDYDHYHGANPPNTTSTVSSNIPPYYKLAFIMRL